uniref:DUF4939 domain-containing protein n=1 Tax=Terrapene triunguis TaxID=2587831 RepID=A0A674IG18_9SAUR
HVDPSPTVTARQDCLSSTENQTLHKQLAQSREENTMLQAQVGPLPSEQNPAVPLHEHFDGNCLKFKGFLDQCHLLFLLCPQMHPTDEARVGLVISLLARKVLDWVSPLLEQDSPVLTNWNSFLIMYHGWGQANSPPLSPD